MAKKRNKRKRRRKRNKKNDQKREDGEQTEIEMSTFLFEYIEEALMSLDDSRDILLWSRESSSCTRRLYEPV